MYSQVFCKVYDEFGWNYYPEIFGAQLLEWLHRRGFAPKTSLDLACGTGILCGILKEQGIQAAGADLSQGMIDIARQRNPEIPFAVADMITYRPQGPFDLVTCTGDALNHILNQEDVAQIFRNVYDYLAPGGYFLFDLLNEGEISSEEPFEMEDADRLRVWFQMTRPQPEQVNLCIRVFAGDTLRMEENIRETVYAPDRICRMLEEAGFRVEGCANRLLADAEPGTTWFIVAGKERT